MTAEHHRRRVVLGIAKLLLAVGIFAFLFYSLRGEAVFARLLREPKDWGRLATAQLLILAALSLNYVRWFLLVRALGLAFRLTDAFRLGALGLMLSQISFGSVGGDLFKAVCIAREQRGRRTEAVASVLIDRVVGMYAMVLVASFGIALVGDTSIGGPTLRTIKLFIQALAVIGTAGVGLLMVPAVTGPAMQRWLRDVPGVGALLERLAAAGAAYRDRRATLLTAIGIGCCTHTLFVLAIWSVGRGLPVEAPSLAKTFVVGPLSLCAGAIPLTPGGLGTFEAAMDRLYMAVGSQPGDGLLVAITYRVMTYVMAAIGAIYYLSARRKMGEVLHEAEELEEELEHGMGGPQHER